MPALEFEDLFATGVEAEVADESDFLKKCSADALHEASGGDAAKLDAETKNIDARTARIYKKIAASAEQSAETKKPANEPSTLEKRFSVDPRAGYREYFREKIGLGKSASQILNDWLTEFPHRNPDVESMLRGVAAEF